MRKNAWITFILMFILIVYLWNTAIKRSAIAQELRDENARLQEEIYQLKDSQNVWVWKMDKSCAEQVQNNFDNGIYLTIKPVKEVNNDGE